YSIFESGLPNLIKLDDYLIAKYPNDPNRRVKSARIDSGDLARGYKKLRKALDKAGKPYIKLVASNSLDEKKMSNMELYEDAHFDSYGVSEKLITSATDPVFGGVYKLVAVKEKDGSYTPKMKCSDSVSKAIIPGKLMAWRAFDEEGKGQCDIIALDDEVFEDGQEIEVINLDPDAFDPVKRIRPMHIERILVPHIIKGELVIDLPTIQQKKDYIREQLTNRVWESELRPEMPHQHYVDLTPKVARLREEMYEKLHGGKI
ncbi:MAG: nicotinate phosphoribosyltransferase, partial [Solobacterium sp.]|nr:nicotinate phosphoribosyltransferase [Solobacterium sp.]